MWEDWNKSSTAASNQVHKNRHLLEHGLPTMQSNIREQVGAQQNHHQKKFVSYEQAVSPEEYETALVNLKILDPNGQASDTYVMSGAESKMLAAGYDQFSVLFNTKVNHDAPSLIHDKLSDFAREIASSKSHEYLKLAQKCRLFYQDPAITDQLKPVETMHNPFGNARNLHKPFKFEGKSSFQEKPHLLWDWEIDNPDQTRWVRNLVANFMDRSIKDLYDVKKVGLQSLFRAETHEYKFMSVFDTKNSEVEKLQLINEVDRMYVDLSRKKERVEEKLMNEICEPLPDIDPISPFADISIKYASGLTRGLDFGAKDGTAVILVNQPTEGMITDDDVVDWQGEACKMLTTLTNYSNSENFSDCLVTNGIIITPKQWMFVTLQKESDNGDRSQAWVDGPHTLFERLDNRNWRAGDSYCTNFNPEVVARLLAYTAL
jgi:hypothetical protein